MVEVVGVEPTSEKRVPGASPCASFYSVLAARVVEEGQPDATASLAVSRGMAQGLQTPWSASSVILKSAADQGSQQDVTTV